MISSVMPVFKILLVLSLVAFASGCSVHRSADTGLSLNVPDRYARSTAAPGEGISVERWWESFGNGQLNALMQEAFENNLDITQAYERLNQSRATLRITSSARSVTASIGVSAGRVRQQSALGGATTDSYQLSGSAAYEIDLWDKLGSRTEAALFESAASEEDLKALYIGISAQLADLYYLAVEQRAQLELTKNTIAAFEDTLERVERRYREGIVAPLDVYQSRQNLAAARSQLPVFEANLARTTHALSILLGRMPEYEIEGAGSNLPPAPVFNAGLPASLIERRPDVRAALARLKASDERVAAAVADRFPSFNLVGEYGGASDDLKDLLDSPNVFWNLLIQAALPVIDGGRRRAEVERTEAVFRENLARYRQTVLRSFGEVEDALAAGSATGERIRTLEDRVSASEAALKLSLDNYLQGLSDYLPVLSAQQRFFDDKSALLAARRQHISESIQLARALAGDWAAEVAAKRQNVDNTGKEDK